MQTVCLAATAIMTILICVHFLVMKTSRPKMLALNATGFQAEYEKLHKRQSIERIMGSLPQYDGNLNCSLLTGERANYEAYQKARQWKFNPRSYRRDLFRHSEDRCKTLREHFALPDQPLTEEERDYPLAYGFLVYDNSIQIYFLLSAIYQPQNAYCIAVDSKSSKLFKTDMDLLNDCFPNVYVIQVDDVQWYKFSVVRGVWTCVRYLAALNHPWKYYQYLSGVDLPLKTNLEMVRIFKQLNGTTNVDVIKIPPDRIRRVKNMDWPLQLYKSSLSGLLTREGINAMMASEKVRKFISIAQKMECPDEALWATIFGNPDALPIPSTFDAAAVLHKLRIEEKAMRKKCDMTARWDKIKNVTIEEPFALHDYYISRYQVWVWPYTDTTNPFCHGKFTHFSCVYGISDLRNLLTRPELIAHKFYLDVEPAAYFCLYEAVRNRAFDEKSQVSFRGNVYSQLAHVRMSRGENPENLTFHLHNCKMEY